ncbi:v-SNARE [Coccidioides immitis RMSCC 3703]|uniref:V-SNARE n=1 Tax=Coccidioides immitis RMSCC 3703 TaxID=454286 RepID=A0A0J8RBI2_COCIT|nr:v-SNARE [Coccidioides immitis RMSCC 3703]
MSNPGQLFLLADHVKLSLLERQRAISLSLEPNSQDGEISRSLESLRDGIESVEKEARRLEEDGDSSFVDLKEEASNLPQQLHDLESQFYENPSSSSKDTISSPNDPSLAEDFIMQEQDDQLDRLGESIGRQHQLSIQIGDELEGQVALLDEVDGHVDRHIGRLDGARRRLGKFKRNARESRGIMWIIGLIILLVILIVILK